MGVFVNLTKCGGTSNLIAIIGFAQTIRDVGDNATVRVDLDGDGSIGNADETSCGFDINGDGDALDTTIPETVTGCAYGTYDQYADEILAEQKVLAIVYRNPNTGKWRIIKYEYIDE